MSFMKKSKFPKIFKHNSHYSNTTFYWPTPSEDNRNYLKPLVAEGYQGDHPESAETESGRNTIETTLPQQHLTTNTRHHPFTKKLGDHPC
jgi:hypothetical protein